MTPFPVLTGWPLVGSRMGAAPGHLVQPQNLPGEF